MKISDIQKIKGIKSITINDENRVVNRVYCSDLLSDVLANGYNTSILITIQNHINTIAVAIQCNISTIILCNNLEATEKMITLANTSSISIFSTDKNQYQTSIAIYSNIS